MENLITPSSEDLKGNNILQFVDDGYDSKETLGGLSDQFKMLIYDYYSKDLSEKIKTSMAALNKQGKFVGGQYGSG